MSIPTYVVVPILIAAFAMLCAEHYIANPEKHIRDIRYLMMVAAVIMIFTQILLAGSFPGVSLPLFILALAWLAGAGLLMYRRLAAR